MSLARLLRSSTGQTAGASQSMLIGAAVQGDTQTAWNTLVSNVGNLNIARAYDSGFGTSLGSKAFHLGQRTVWWSFKPTLTEMQDLAGENGTAAQTTTVNKLRTLLNTLVGYQVWIGPWHEPENDSQWQTSAGKTTFRLGWARFADEVHSYGQSGWKTAWTMMAYSWKNVSGRVPDDWYPGNDYVDIVGLDAYNEGSLNDPQRWDSPGFEYGEPHASESLGPVGGGYYQGGVLSWCEAKNKPFAVGEYGSIINHNAGTPTWVTSVGIANTKPAWITYHADYLYGVQFRRSTRCLGITYFDVNGRDWAGDPSESWQLANDGAASYTAFSGVNDQYGLG